MRNAFRCLWVCLFILVLGLKSLTTFALDPLDDQRVTNIEIQLNAQSSEIFHLAAGAGLLNAQYNQINAKQIDNENGIEQVETSIADLTASVGEKPIEWTEEDTLFLHVNAIDGSLDSLSSDFDALSSTVGDSTTGLVGDLATLTSLVGSSTEEWDTSDTVTSKINGLDGDVADLTQRLDDPATGLSSKASVSSVDALTESVDSLSDLIEDSSTGLASKASIASVTTLSNIVNNAETGLPSKASSSSIDSLSASFTTLSNTVNDAETGLASKASQTSLNDANTGLPSKASQADLTTLSNTVSTKAAQADLTALTNTVSAKADQANLTTLSNTVSAKADQADLIVLTNIVNTKAAQDDYTTLYNYAHDTGSGLPSKASNEALNTLNTTVNGHTTTVNGLTTSVNGLTTSVNGLTTTVNGHTTTLNGLTTTTNGLTTTTNGLTTTTNGLTTTVNSHTTTLNGLTTTVNTLNAWPRACYGSNADPSNYVAAAAGRTPWGFYDSAGGNFGASVYATASLTGVNLRIPTTGALVVDRAYKPDWSPDDPNSYLWTNSNTRGYFIPTYLYRTPSTSPFNIRLRGVLMGCITVDASGDGVMKPCTTGTNGRAFTIADIVIPRTSTEFAGSNTLKWTGEFCIVGGQPAIAPAPPPA